MNTSLARWTKKKRPAQSDDVLANPEEDPDGDDKDEEVEDEDHPYRNDVYDKGLRKGLEDVLGDAASQGSPQEVRFLPKLLDNDIYFQRTPFPLKHTGCHDLLILIWI